MKRPAKAVRAGADKKRRSERLLPKIEHERREIPGEPGSLVDKTIYEERGLRRLVLRQYRDVRLTVADIPC